MLVEYVYSVMMDIFWLKENVKNFHLKLFFNVKDIKV